tara:strand:- start:457 stop:609 length:153 start_codon:yes stop_codon:yes gene_type:complete
MTKNNGNKLELARISPEMTKEEIFQALVAAFERQGLKVKKNEEKKPMKPT